MKYTEEQKKMYLNTITELRTIGYTWEQIEQEFQERFGINKIQHLRKNWELLNKHLELEAKMDEPTATTRIAKKMALLKTEQKVLVKQRNILHNDANIIAFRKLILSELSKIDWKHYYPTTTATKVYKTANKHYKKGVIIVADEHFRGNMDIKRLNALYDSIEQQIKDNKYNEVELWYLGDGIDGLIHLGSLASNDGSILPAITYSNIVIERINKIPQVKAIKYVAQSNHSETRSLGTNRSELAKEDLNYMIVNTLRYGLRKDIEIYSDDVMMFNYEKIHFALLHGHQKYAKSRAKLLEFWNSKYCYVPEVIIMGHWHSFKQTEYGLNKWVIVAPAVKIDDGDYERDEGFVSTGQYLIMEVVNRTPQIKIVSLER